MTRFRATIRGDKAELRGYFTAPDNGSLAPAAQAAAEFGQLIVSAVADDYNPFRSGVTDSMVGEAMNALVIYYTEQGHVVRPESVDYQALRVALQSVHSPHLDYYDPMRQDRISEHDCTFEDGSWWFGHGMECLYPELHSVEAASPSDEELAERAQDFDIDDEGGPGSPRDIFILGYRAAQKDTE